MPPLRTLLTLPVYLPFLILTSPAPTTPAPPAVNTALTRLATQTPVTPLPDPHGRAYATDGSDVTDPDPDPDLDLDLEPALSAAEFCPRTRRTTGFRAKIPAQDTRSGDTREPSARIPGPPPQPDRRQA
ncbi:hypothetical protein [Streptomyces phaeochromogenes]|uniref:hypothetical protein n=1 Tax=Streptomyces phaeochromogenes TaxID=1923 RepID=UPI002DD92211|nr:hypothetical protein [Streptomyces phaeochromogenes]WRZ29902.1 hypothetical protein OG931_20200 [Streptomyces phaeochromogenes]